MRRNELEMDEQVKEEGTQMLIYDFSMGDLHS